MKIKKTIIYLLLFSIVFMLPGKKNQNDKTVQRDFGFGAMEIFEFSNLTSDLITKDLNRDGLDDLLFLNNQVSRLEILIRKKSPYTAEDFPSLDERFHNRGFVLDNWVQFFQVTNINGDSKPDIVTIDEQRGLLVHFQQAGGYFSEPVSLHIKAPGKLSGFETADLNGDGHIDILAYSKQNAEILWNNGSGKFAARSTVDFSVYGCSGALPADVNGDKIPDLLFYFPKENLPLRIRPGTGSGQFDWEEALLLPDNQTIEKVDLTGEGNCQLAMILKNGLILRLYEFLSHKGSALFEENETIPKRLPLKGISRKNPPTWATADVDRDGYDDFCAAAPLLSQILLYKGSSAGLSYSPVAIDSLRDIKSLTITGEGDIVVFSEAEKAIAVHRNKDLTAFPRFLKAPGEPAAVAACGESTIFALYKDKSLRLHLFNTQKLDSGPIESYEPGMRNIPRAVKVFPLAGERHWGIIFFMPYDKPQMYRLFTGKITAVPAEAFQALGSTLEPGAVTVVGTKQQQALLVTEGNVARLYHWVQDRFVVAHQLNPHVESARLTAGCRLQGEENGFLLYDDAGQDLYRFLLNPSAETVRIHLTDGIDDLSGLTTLRLKKKQGILLVGNSRLQWLQGESPLLRLKNIDEYVTGTEKANLWNLLSVSLGSPGRPMAALLDANNGSVEIVGMRNGKLVEELVFNVFQDPGFRNQLSETDYEPHDLTSGDFNGDNIRDLAILVHNKLIIYLGE
jgi:hypothetical protein